MRPNTGRARLAGVFTNAADSTMFVDPIYRFMEIYSGRISSESDLGIVWNASAIAELIFGPDWDQITSPEF